jgi:long-chain acyl-CoA synthetase
MNTAQFLAKAALTFGERPALSVGGRVFCDYRQYARDVAALAGALTETLGLKPGDRLALAMTNSPEYWQVLLAAWWAGICAVPMNAKLHAREFAYILDNSGARACFVTPDVAETVAPLADEIAMLERVVDSGAPEFAALLKADQIPVRAVAPDAPAWLFYTSGTTGRPKGATLTHRNMLMMTLSYYADIDSISERDCVIHAAPVSHGSGCYGIPHLAKAANQVIPESHGFDPAEIADLLETYDGVSMFFAPTMMVRLMASPALDGAPLGGLKTIFYGGGPMYVNDLLGAIERFGPRLVQIYGQGEAPMTITWLSKAMHMDRDHPRYLERLASTGIARTDVEVRVVDADDRDLPVGEAGEVVVRGDVVMAGYWRNPDATEKALRGGWLHTGDVGAFDDDGFLTLKDRSKDMIISGGTNIYPREVEEALLKHPAVLETSVVGRPHPDWGEEVVAFVVARPGEALSEPDLDRVCLDNIARFKRPKAYRFVDALPKNNYGKVLKTDLRQRLDDEDTPD